MYLIKPLTKESWRALAIIFAVGWLVMFMMALVLNHIFSDQIHILQNQIHQMEINNEK